MWAPPFSAASANEGEKIKLEACLSWNRQKTAVMILSGWIGFVRRYSSGRRIFYYGSAFVKFATNNIIKFVNMDLFLRESYKSIDILFNYDMIKS